MAGFASFDELIADQFAGKALTVDFLRIGPASPLVGSWQSQWTATPGAGAAPAAGSGTAGAGGTARTGTEASPVAGAWCFPDLDPEHKYVSKLSMVTSQQCTLAIYDRLVDVSGIALSSTGSKNVNSVALPRYTDGANVEAWLEVTTATTVSIATVALNSYTTGDGTAAQSGGNVAFPAAATPAGTAIRLPLSASKQGVRSVETLNVVVAAGAGVANLVLARRIATIPLATNTENRIDYVGSLPGRIFDGACLYAMVLPTFGISWSSWGSLIVGVG